MFKKLKQTWYADDFSYFIRYFGVFTLIFSTMTLIIIQVMRSGLYKTVDDNLYNASQNPTAVVSHALARTVVSVIPNNSDKSVDGETDSTDLSEIEGKPKDDHRFLSGNMDFVLFNEEGKSLGLTDNFLGLDKIHFNRRYLNQIKQVRMINTYGQEENYRAIFLDVDPDNTISGVKYAAVLINVNQLEQTSQNHEQIIGIVMISFWLISIIASLYLARVSVKPLLESMQRQKAFVENASHELRTPLSVLQNRLETLFRKPEATIMDSSESIASSLEEVRNMRMLTTNLLNLARRDDGITPEMTEIEPYFFTSTFTNYEMVADESGKVFRFENKVYKPIRTDKTLLKQLMTILFDNALKYTDEDGEIDLIAQATERYLYIKVMDNGPGISAQDKKKIFDRFYRVDKARTRQRGGFGLGLSLGKQIVDALKGSILVKDRKPKGTIFEVKLPIKILASKKG